MVRWVRDRALGLVILTAFWLSWVGQAFFAAATWLDEQKDHGVKAPGQVWDAFLDADYWEFFWMDTLSNWQSEFLQWGSVIWLTVWLVHRGSAESRDSEDRIEAKIDAILGEERVREIEARLDDDVS